MSKTTKQSFKCSQGCCSQPGASTRSVIPAASTRYIAGTVMIYQSFRSIISNWVERMLRSGLGFFLGFGVVNKKAHHIKQPRKPADYKYDMYGKDIWIHVPYAPKRVTWFLFFY